MMEDDEKYWKKVYKKMSKSERKPTFFSNFDLKEERMTQPIFKDAQLIKAYEDNDDFNELYADLKEVTGNDKLPKIAIKNRILTMLMEGQLEFKQLDNIDANIVKGYVRKDYAEFTLRGVFIPAHLLEGAGFSRAVYENKKKVKEGTKFDVAVSKNKIVLTPQK